MWLHISTLLGFISKWLHHSSWQDSLRWVRFFTFFLIYFEFISKHRGWKESGKLEISWTLTVIILRNRNKLIPPKFFLGYSPDDDGSGKPSSAGRGRQLSSSCHLAFLGNSLVLHPVRFANELLLKQECSSCPLFPSHILQSSSSVGNQLPRGNLSVFWGSDFCWASHHP